MLIGTLEKQLDFNRIYTIGFTAKIDMSLCPSTTDFKSKPSVIDMSRIHCYDYNRQLFKFHEELRKVGKVYLSTLKQIRCNGDYMGFFAVVENGKVFYEYLKNDNELADTFNNVFRTNYSGKLEKVFNVYRKSFEDL